MANKNHSLLFYLLGAAFLIYYSGSASAQTLQDFMWKHRLIAVVANSNSNLLSDVTDLSTRYACEFKDRDLKIVHVTIGSPIWTEISRKINVRDGLYLIGYDGQIKDTSSDLSLLSRVNNVIDKMPMRRAELSKRDCKNIC